MHIGYIDEQVLVDLKRDKKVGSYLVFLLTEKGRIPKHVQKHNDSFKKGNVTISWD